MTELINKINLRFESGNSVPVDSVRITREEWETIQREVDDWKQQADGEAIVSGSYRDERDAALEREQALAAHVERQNDLLEMLVDVPELMGGKWESMSRDVIMEKPATSLARRDKIKQAEAYKAGWDASGEGWNAEYPGDAHLTAQWEDERDEWLRQQAAALS